MEDNLESLPEWDPTAKDPESQSLYCERLVSQYGGRTAATRKIRKNCALPGVNRGEVTNACWPRVLEQETR
jgi:hypothetical protein